MKGHRRCKGRGLEISTAALFLLVGCTGHISSGGDEPASASPTTAGGSRGISTAGGSSSAGHAGSSPDTPAIVEDIALRRFTSFEYDNAVRDLLGATLHPARSFPAQSRDGTFDNDVGNLTVSATLVEQYLAAAESLTAEALKDESLARLLSCSVSALDESCAKRSLLSVAKKAYRRPLSTEESADLTNAYSEGAAAGGVRKGLEYGLERVLVSPNFLYWIETGATDAKPTVAARLPLTSFEVAARLSRLLVGSIPDDTLLSAAESGQLSNADGRLAQAQRLLRASDGAPTAAARANLAQFHNGWLGLSGLASMQKGVAGWDAELAGAMREETETFLGDLVWSRGDSTGMFLTHVGYVNEKLGAVYGVKVAGTALLRTELDPAVRTGILTQASFLALTSNDGPKPMKRAAFVLGRFLCAAPPPPPPDAPTSVPSGTPGNSERERFEHLTGNAPCSACHTALNGIGWTFNEFDAIGRVRAADAGGAPLDLHGALHGTDVDGNFASVGELSLRLASSRQVQACMVRHWFRFANGRFETPADDAALQSLVAAFDKSGHRIEDLLNAIVQADEFASRVVGP